MANISNQYSNDFSNQYSNEPSNLESKDSKSGMLLSSLGKAQTNNEPYLTKSDKLDSKITSLNEQLFFNTMVENCCFASVLFICTGDQTKKCTAHYKQGVRTFNCNKNHINLRDNRFCRNVLNQIVDMEQQCTLANIKAVDFISSCNTKNCSDWPCKHKPAPVKMAPKISEAITINMDPLVEIIRLPVKPVTVNNIIMDTLNLESTNPILYNLWKTKYKSQTCQQINKMFLEKEKKWKQSNVTQFETNDDIFEIEMDHERKKYADFWAYFEGTELYQDERIVDKAKRVVAERPEIFDEYINMYWNTNEREYILGTNIKSFHTWLLNSTHSQTYQYMLENDVSYKTAKNHFKPVHNNIDKTEKMRKLYFEMMEKEEKACIARLTASKNLLNMTSMESM